MLRIVKKEVYKGSLTWLGVAVGCDICIAFPVVTVVSERHKP